MTAYNAIEWLACGFLTCIWTSFSFDLDMLETMFFTAAGPLTAIYATVAWVVEKIVTTKRKLVLSRGLLRLK
jgi:4-amino-4-deoxy-L-arabinose transferase-like glycosyltransferase